MGKNIWNRYEVPFWHSDREAPGTSMAYHELLSHWKFVGLDILKLYRDFLTACQCQGTGADVAGNT